MAGEEVLFTTIDEDQSVREDRTEAPELFTLDCGQLPFERMGDAQFELLVADVYKSEINDNTENWYDTVSRLNDGSDQGRDVIMFKDGIPAGVIQCKRLKKKLELDAVIYEICKFFLYAHIRPQIAPPVGEVFRYFIAVADNVSTELFEFMQGTGHERFDKLLAEFQTKCATVRLKSETLKKHEKLKDLSKEDLCEIVWQWVPNLITKVLKKDSLSSMVGKHQSVKSTYFKLESDATAIIEVIRQYLESQGGTLSGGDAAYLHKIRTEYINRELREGDQINIGLIQGTDLIPFLKGMLAPEEGTLDQNFGNRPVVLTAGAEAATSQQWSTINDLVKAYPNPLVFMVGCGEIAGSVLISWKTVDGMSWIDPSWKPAPAQKYRAGWCWVTDPAEKNIDCYVLVENAPKDAGIDHGNVSLRLAFNDLIVWPTLGNDFTNSVMNKNSQLRRVIASQAEDTFKRPNLILASQHIADLQDVVRSLVDYHARRLASPIAVAAANSQQLQGCKMQLYSATGVFPATDSEQNTRSSPPAMQPPSRVMRRSTNGGLTLTLTWDTNLTLERVKGHRLQGGVVQDDLAPAALEFHELFNRYPPDADCLDAVKNELALLNNLVQIGGIKDSQEFAYQTKHGVISGNEFTLEDLASSGKYVMHAAQALSYLKSHKHVAWLTEPGTMGHLQLSDPNEGIYNILAWTNSDYRVRPMANELYRWAREATNHPQLVVFADCTGTVKDDKPSQERFDITNTPSVKNSFTDIEMVNKVYLFSLKEIESMYDEADAISAEDFLDEISIRRKKLDA